MKKLIIYSFMSIFLLAIACKKNENAKIPKLSEIPIPFLVKDKATDQIIASQEPDKFSAKFSVGMQYPDGAKPTKYDVLVKKTSGTTTSIKTFQADITTFPTVLPITGVQLKALFDNKTILLGDKFDIGVDITMPDGTKYQAFPSVGVPYGSNVPASGGASPTITYEAICKFDMADYGAIGTTVPYVIVADGWADYSPGDVIGVKIIDATHLSFVYPTVESVHPIVVAIDPNTNITSAPSTVIGGYGDGLLFSVQSVAGASNFVGPCQLLVSINLSFTSRLGSYGNKVISFKRQ